MTIHRWPDSLQTYSLEFLKDRLAQWQRVCRMEDWLISVRIIREIEFSDKCGCGEVDMWQHRKAARISLMDPIDHNAKSHHPYNMEQTLAHEFVHIICWSWKQSKEAGSLAYIDEEHATDALAYALCAISLDPAQRW